jgi:uncharacterized membrane protein YadS
VLVVVVLVVLMLAVLVVLVVLVVEKEPNNAKSNNAKKNNLSIFSNSSIPAHSFSFLFILDILNSLSFIYIYYILF